MFRLEVKLTKKATAYNKFNFGTVCFRFVVICWFQLGMIGGGEDRMKMKISQFIKQIVT
jgi:hypothetical protein